jgi:hypothetical protein
MARSRPLQPDDDYIGSTNRNSTNHSSGLVNGDDMLAVLIVTTIIASLAIELVVAIYGREEDWS